MQQPRPAASLASWPHLFKRHLDAVPQGAAHAAPAMVTACRQLALLQPAAHPLQQPAAPAVQRQLAVAAARPGSRQAQQQALLARQAGNLSILQNKVPGVQLPLLCYAGNQLVNCFTIGAQDSPDGSLLLLPLVRLLHLPAVLQRGGREGCHCWQESGGSGPLSGLGAIRALAGGSTLLWPGPLLLTLLCCVCPTGCLCCLLPLLSIICHVSSIAASSRIL